jgi:hypothetical protein
MIFVGIACMILSGYFGLKYGNIPSKFDYVLYEKWISQYRKKHPDAEKEYCEKYNNEHPNSALTDPPLKDSYMRRILWGKRSIVIFATVGGILATVGSIV